MNRPHLIPTIAALLTISSIAPVSARTWIIQPDGSGDAPNIQAGIDSAATADSVVLADGTFSGPGNRDIRFKGKEITVTSMNGPEMSIVDCERVHRGFSLSTGETPNSLLTGVTIANGLRERGGGIAIGMGSPTVIGNIILDCEATVQGGGIRVTGASASPFIGNNQVLRCRVTGSGGGGGIEINGASPTVNGNTISNNQAPEGGGILVTGASATPTITDNVISGNTASAQGGGIRVGPLIDLTLTGNVLYANGAASGGGLYIEGVGSASTVERNTIAANSATAAGSGVFFKASDLIFHRSIVAFNIGAAGIECDGTDHSVSCSVVHGNSGGDVICGNDGGANSQEDPLFCFTPSVNDYTIAENSPAAPANSACGELIGALPVNCGSTPVLYESWGKIKRIYRK